MNILLTGAGGVYIKHLIRKLDKNIFDEVTIVDCNYKTLKNIRANFKYKVPKGDNKKFLPAISKIIKTRNIKVVVCVVDKELIKFHKLNNKILLLQPKRNFSKLCLNKFKLCRKLFKTNINNFDTYLLSNYKNTFHFPIIIKPIYGCGSRGVVKIKNEKQLNNFKKKKINKKKYIVQKIIKGDEYTVSVILDKSSKDFQIIPKKIIKKKRFTREAITEKNNLINSICKKIIKNFKPGGPFNVQCIANKKNLEIFEINPRLSTSSTLTAASGINEINTLVKKHLNKKFSIKKLKWKSSVKLLRNKKENFIYKSK